MEAALRGILGRPRSLGIRDIDFDVRVHPRKDPGCCNEGVAYLRDFAAKYRRALLLFDHEGCGQEETAAIQLENQIEERLRGDGWGNRAAAVVIDPELEIWVWSDSPHVDHALGWSNHQPGLRTWLREKGFLADDALKPPRPKETLEAALREVKKPRSSAIYKALAEKVSLTRCTDPAFGKLKTILHVWFSHA
jgi:hypothetical protein